MHGLKDATCLPKHREDRLADDEDGTSALAAVEGAGAACQHKGDQTGQAIHRRCPRIALMNAAAQG